MLKPLVKLEKTARGADWPPVRVSAARQALLGALLNPHEDLPEGATADIFAHGEDLVRILRDPATGSGFVQRFSVASLAWEVDTDGAFQCALEPGYCERVVLEVAPAMSSTQMLDKWIDVTDAKIEGPRSHLPDAGALRRGFPDTLILAEFYYDLKAHLTETRYASRSVTTQDYWRLAGSVARHTLLRKHREFAVKNRVACPEFVQLCDAVLSGWAAEKRISRFVSASLGEGYDYFGGQLRLHAHPVTEPSEREKATLDSALSAQAVPLEPSRVNGAWFGVILNSEVDRDLLAALEVALGEVDALLGGVPVAVSSASLGAFKSILKDAPVALHWRGDDNADQPVQAMELKHLLAERARLRWMLSCPWRAGFAPEPVGGDQGTRTALYLVEHELEFREEWERTKAGDDALSALKWNRINGGDDSPFVIHQLVDGFGNVMGASSDPAQAIVRARRTYLSHVPLHYLTQSEFAEQSLAVSWPVPDGSPEEARLREALLQSFEAKHEIEHGEPSSQAWLARTLAQLDVMVKSQPFVCARLTGGPVLVAYSPENIPSGMTAAEIVNYSHHAMLNHAYSQGEYIPPRAAQAYPDLHELVTEFPSATAPVVH